MSAAELPDRAAAGAHAVHRHGQHHRRARTVPGVRAGRDAACADGRGAHALAGRRRARARAARHLQRAACRDALRGGRPGGRGGARTRRATGGAQGLGPRAVARQHALRVRHVEQMRDLAHVVILVVVEPAVGVGDAPQVLDQADAVLERELALDDADRGVEAVELLRLGAALLEQRRGLARPEAEQLGERALRGRGLFGAFLVVGPARFVQQHRDREL